MSRLAIMSRKKTREVPDPVPIHLPGTGAPLTLRDELKRYVREQVSAAAQEEQMGTFEEEDDFEEDDGDQVDMLTPYTVVHMDNDLESYSPDADPVPEAQLNPAKQDAPADVPDEETTDAPKEA